jgi:glutamyl/glutaminyl-tRNA synthetase
MFVHLPLLHDLSGRKLSKRSNEGQGFHVKEFRQNGILPEALVNYLVLFGWSSQTDSDVLSMNELVERVYLSVDYVDVVYS